MIELAGIIPHAGYQLEYKNLLIEVLKSTVKRVLQIKVTITETEEEQEEKE